jgi:hypothetical protein
MNTPTKSRVCPNPFSLETTLGLQDPTLSADHRRGCFDHSRDLRVYFDSGRWISMVTGGTVNLDPYVNGGDEVARIESIVADALAGF